MQQLGQSYSIALNQEVCQAPISINVGNETGTQSAASHDKTLAAVISFSAALSPRRCHVQRANPMPDLQECKRCSHTRPSVAPCAQEVTALPRGLRQIIVIVLAYI